MLAHLHPLLIFDMVRVAPQGRQLKGARSFACRHGAHCVELRIALGPVGLLMWAGTRRACKRPEGIQGTDW